VLVVPEVAVAEEQVPLQPALAELQIPEVVVVEVQEIAV
jgi:hypothetical protein